MKKILVTVICICICLVLCACNEPVYTSTEPTKKPSSSTIEENNIWCVQFYVDDFNQKTNEWYVVNEDLFWGQFSNSATTNSALSVRAVVNGKKQY